MMRIRMSNEKKIRNENNHVARSKKSTKKLFLWVPNFSFPNQTDELRIAILVIFSAIFTTVTTSFSSYLSNVL